MVFFIIPISQLTKTENWPILTSSETKLTLDSLIYEHEGTVQAVFIIDEISLSEYLRACLNITLNLPSVSGKLDTLPGVAEKEMVKYGVCWN